MTRIKQFATLTAAIMLAMPTAVVIAQERPAPPPTEPVQPLEYAVKFVCGRTLSSARPQAATGNYYTMINIHNPGRPLEVSHKVVLAAVLGERGGMTGFSTDIGLRYDEAVDLDCPWIARQLAAAGIRAPGLSTGFVVLQARQELDVVAVYTAAPTTTNQVATMHTERVPVRRLAR